MRKIIMAALFVLGMVLSGCGGSAELTASELGQLDKQERAIFLLCQSDKYIADHGKRAWNSFSLKYDTPHAVETALLKRGYSCTEEEVHDYLS